MGSVERWSGLQETFNGPATKWKPKLDGAIVVTSASDGEQKRDTTARLNFVRQRQLKGSQPVKLTRNLVSGTAREACLGINPSEFVSDPRGQLPLSNHKESGLPAR